VGEANPDTERNEYVPTDKRETMKRRLTRRGGDDRVGKRKIIGLYKNYRQFEKEALGLPTNSSRR